MRAMAISANRRYLAVSERGGERATVTVFDLQHEQGRKRKVLTAGDAPGREFVCVAFSPDSKYLIGQTGGPEWTLVLWLWEKQKVLASVKTSNPNNPVTQVSRARCATAAWRSCARVISHHFLKVTYYARIKVHTFSVDDHL